MVEIFYSLDGGRIWYWGRYSREDISIARRSGWLVTKATRRNRRKLA